MSKTLNPEHEAARANIRKTLADILQESEDLLAQIHANEASDGWIARNERGGVCMKYDMSRGKPENPLATTASRATIFPDYESCYKTAHNTFNAAGGSATAVRLTTALAEEIVKINQLIEYVDSRP